MKRCTKCGLEKDFYANSNSWCKDCRKQFQRERRQASPERVNAQAEISRILRPNAPETAWRSMLKRVYGVTAKWYYEQLERQGGTCAICRGPQQAPRTKFCVDHDHKTRSVRKLLCHKCNTGVALFNEDPQLLRAAAEYFGS